MITQTDLTTARNELNAIKGARNSEMNTVQQRRLEAFATTRYEMMVDQFTREFCAANKGE